MGYCGIHGEYSKYESGCPDCREAEERSGSALAEIAGRLQEIAERDPEPTYNPDFGDFQCPHCRYQALRRDASRCPLCHGAIRPDYWAAVAAAERERRRRAAEEAERARQRVEIARQEQAARALAAAEAAAIRDRESRRNTWRLLAVALIVGVLLAAAHAITRATATPELVPSMCAAPPEGVVALPPAEDTSVGTVYFKEGEPESPELRYGGWGDVYYSLLRFDTASVANRGAAPRVALCLFTRPPRRNPELKIRPIVENWSGSSVTIRDLPRMGAAIVSIATLKRGWNIVELGVTGEAWIAQPESNYGVAIEPGKTWETNGHFASSEGSPSESPKLLIFAR